MNSWFTMNFSLAEHLYITNAVRSIYRYDINDNVMMTICLPPHRSSCEITPQRSSGNNRQNTCQSGNFSVYRHTFKCKLKGSIVGSGTN